MLTSKVFTEVKNYSSLARPDHRVPLFPLFPFLQAIFFQLFLIFLKSKYSERQRQRQRPILVNGDTWEWVWDRFSSVTIDQH